MDSWKREDKSLFSIRIQNMCYRTLCSARMYYGLICGPDNILRCLGSHKDCASECFAE
jgi:hypothetical protein